MLKPVISAFIERLDCHDVTAAITLLDSLDWDRQFETDFPFHATSRLARDFLTQDSADTAPSPLHFLTASMFVVWINRPYAQVLNLDLPIRMQPM